jgi:hypothetical protein
MLYFPPYVFVLYTHYFKNGGYRLNKTALLRIVCSCALTQLSLIFRYSLWHSVHWFGIHVLHRALFNASMHLCAFIYSIWHVCYRGSFHLFICWRHSYTSYRHDRCANRRVRCERPPATSWRRSSVCCERWRVHGGGGCGAVFSLCFYVLSKQNIYYPTK